MGSRVHRRPTYALSIKQPWAAPIVAGRRTIEVRKWATTIRGRVYIQSARIADPPAESWELVPSDTEPLGQLGGGLIGAADLTSCVRYDTRSRCRNDVDSHLNDPNWFCRPRMFGFTFRRATTIPFTPCRGSVRFFRVNSLEGT